MSHAKAKINRDPELPWFYRFLRKVSSIGPLKSKPERFLVASLMACFKKLGENVVDADDKVSWCGERTPILNKDTRALDDSAVAGGNCKESDLNNFFGGKKIVCERLERDPSRRWWEGTTTACVLST